MRGLFIFYYCDKGAVYESYYRQWKRIFDNWTL